MTLCNAFLCAMAPAREPHRDAICQHTLNGAAVEDGQQLLLQVDPPEDPQKVEMLLGLFHNIRGVEAPLEVSVHVHSQEPACC